MPTLTTATRLTAEEKKALAERYAPMVKHVASRIAVFLPPFVDQQDLINDGVVGLMDCLERFDPSKGIQFQTFAARRIKGAILDALRAHDWMSRGARQRSREINVAQETLHQSLGRTPSETELASQVGITAGELRKRRQEDSQGQVFSLDEVRSLSDGAEEPRLSSVPSPDPSVEDLVGKNVRREVLLEGLKTLSEREQLVLQLYYFEELNVREIAGVLGVSEPRVSQLHGRSLRKLRERLDGQKAELIAS